MKPRQTMKNFQNSNLTSLYQSSTAATSQPSTTGPQQASIRNIDLAKLGLTNPDDVLPNIQATANPTSQEEIIKCLQAIYGKNSAEILQKTLNEWPMQSASPPDYIRTGSVGCGTSKGSGASSSGLSYNPNTNNNYTNHSKQDIQFSNNNQKQSHQTSNINNFRMSSTSNALLAQQQYSTQQKKSVLSLHKYHQSDSSNRGLNHQPHHMSTTSASFANHNNTNACLATSTSASSSESNNLSTLGGVSRGSGSGNSINNRISGPTPTNVNASNVVDPLSSTDNMFYDHSMQIEKDASSSGRRSLLRHQQLQKLLIATGNQAKPKIPSATLTLTNEVQMQRNINHGNSTSQIQNQMPQSSSNQSQPAFSSVPKSLLNLAACTSTASATPNSSSLPTSRFSSMVSQLRSSHPSGQDRANNNIVTSNSGQIGRKALIRSNSGNISLDVSSESNLGDEPSLTQHIKSNVGVVGNNVLPARSNTKQYQWSLLSEDQSLYNSTRGNSKNVCNVISVSSKIPVSHTNKSTAQTPSSKEGALLATLQEKAMKAGVSIGEINKSVNSSTSLLTLSGPNSSPSPNDTSKFQSGNSSISPNQQKDEQIDRIDRKEIESALSRVEARNDLSLLYPPMLLASNSQKQINALSAGLQGTEDSELFTREVKRIILEECNIIYECKECSNLFRSLANLVKHKRTYCTERNHVESNKRSNANPSLPLDQDAATAKFANSTRDGRGPDPELYSNQNELRRLSDNANSSFNPRKVDKRPNIIMNDLKNMRAVRNPSLRVHSENKGTLSRNHGSMNLKQSSLSRILQSEPKNRLQVSRDTALLGALNMTSAIDSDMMTIGNSFDNEQSVNDPSNQVDVQLVRNSSLAQTLLNEKLSRSEVREHRDRRPTPKRKLLEDCIKKVKRDKLLNEDEERVMISDSLEQSNAMDIGVYKEMSHETEEDDHDHGDSSKLENPYDSDADSDILTIDLGVLNSKTSKRIKTIENDTSSSTVTSNPSKMSSSSALLKALTRPVDTKKQSERDLIEINESKTKSPAQQDLKNPAQLQDYKSQGNEIDIDSQVSSPLFDKYTCDICETDYEDLSRLMNHTMEAHTLEKMVYPCIFCSFSFIALENVCRHIVEIHKKNKTQVHRLKDVVRSRSHLSCDFLACSDYPLPPYDDECMDQVAMAKDSNPSHSDSEGIKVDGQSKIGMVTRGKKRVDYNTMVNGDTIDSSGYSMRTRKSRSRSADQTPNSETSTIIGQEKAASIDGRSLVVDDRSSRISDEDSIRHEQIDICSDNFSKNEDDSKNVGKSDSQEAHNDESSVHIDFDTLETEDRSSDPEPDIDGDIHDDQQVESGQVPDRYQSDSQNDYDIDRDSNIEQRETESEPDLDIDDDFENYNNADQPIQNDDNLEQEDRDNQNISDSDSNEGECDQSDEDDSTSSSDSASNSSSSNTSHSDNSSAEQMVERRSQNALISEPLEEAVNVSDMTKQSPSLNKSSASESTPSSSSGTGSGSSGGSGGGIMKLKIQLKTRPDEKSKVYEIV